MENYRKKYSKKPHIQSVSIKSQKPHIQSIAARSQKPRIQTIAARSKNHVSKPLYRKKWEIIGRNTVKNHVSKR